MTVGRWISLIMLFIFLAVSGPVGCKKSSTDKGTVDNAVKTEKPVESEPEKKHDEEYYKWEEEDDPDELVSDMEEIKQYYKGKEAGEPDEGS